MTNTLKQSITAAQKDITDTLALYFNAQIQTDDRVKEATQYSINNGGKRLRPLLVYATGRMLGAKKQDLDVAAAAIECIHSYSLVHDDLPAMDDDDLRRGKPTCHIAFDEATAILAGDALQTMAFELLASHEFSVSHKQQLSMITRLSRAAGISGMVGGQALDIAATDKSISISELEHVHRLKTGALLNCAIELGALCAPSITDETLKSLKLYGDAIGLAFQVQDDILDVEGDTQTLGKPQGSDEGHNKSTYPALLGLENAKLKADKLIENALNALDSIDADTQLLEELAKFIVSRDH